MPEITPWLLLANCIWLLGVGVFQIYLSKKIAETRRETKEMHEQGKAIEREQEGIMRQFATVGTTLDWRTLSPAAQAALRMALTQVLNEMKALDN